MSPEDASILRVVFDSPIFSEQVHGGISRYFSQLHAQFAGRDDIDSRVVAGLHANAYLDRSIPGTIAVRALRLPPRLRRRAGRLNDAVATRLVGRFHPQIVHHTTYDQRRVPGARSITTVHDLIHDLYPEYFALDPRYAAKQARAALDADGVICVSESTRQDMERIYGTLSVPVVVSHHGLSTPIVTDDELERLIDLRLGRNQRPRLLFVGARAGYKGFDLLLEALALLAHQANLHVDLHCVGGPLNGRERDTIERLGLDGSHITAGPSDDRHLVQQYRAATLTVYPSAYEGFGLPVLESMAQGCPVVCGRHSSLIEVGGAAAHFFDAQEADALAARLAAVLALDPDAYRSSAFASRRHASAFTWERAADRHAAFYRTVLDR